MLEAYLLWQARGSARVFTASCRFSMDVHVHDIIKYKLVFKFLQVEFRMCIVLFIPLVRNKCETKRQAL